MTLPHPVQGLIDRWHSFEDMFKQASNDNQVGRRDRKNFVQRLYSRFGILCVVRVLCVPEINNLRIISTLPGFDSRRLHQIFLYQ